MEITGTLQMADGSIDHITAHGDGYGDGYDTAKAALDAAIPEGAKPNAVRKDS